LAHASISVRSGDHRGRGSGPGDDQRYIRQFRWAGPSGWHVVAGSARRGVSSRDLMPEEAAETLYVLSVFYVGNYDVYRKYLTTASPIVQELGGDLVVMGKKAAEVRIRFRGTTWCRAQRKLAGMPG
jgi:hypothetical protein